MRREFALSPSLALTLGCAEAGSTMLEAQPDPIGTYGGATSESSAATDTSGGTEPTSKPLLSSIVVQTAGTRATSLSITNGGARSSTNTQLRTDIVSILSAGGLPVNTGGFPGAGGARLGGSSISGGQTSSGVQTGVGGSKPTPGSTAAKGDCCPDGDCICHGADPPTAIAITGTFKTASYAAATGTIHYPTDAAPPLAGVALCGGFTNSGPEMTDWGPFYASWGIVTIIVTTGALDLPDLRATALLNAIKELKAESAKTSSPLFGKLGDRFGVSGYSMGGGGTTIAAKDDPTIRTGVGLAPWGPVTGMSVPVLFLCGDADTVAGITVPSTASGTASMQVVIAGYTHFDWFGPTAISGRYALAWQKVFLEGDIRWKPILSEKVSGVATLQLSMQ